MGDPRGGRVQEHQDNDNDNNNDDNDLGGRCRECRGLTSHKMDCSTGRAAFKSAPTSTPTPTPTAPLDKTESLFGCLLLMLMGVAVVVVGALVAFIIFIVNLLVDHV